MLASNMSHRGDEELAVLLILETRPLMRTSCVCALKLARRNTKESQKERLAQRRLPASRSASHRVEPLVIVRERGKKAEERVADKGDRA